MQDRPSTIARHLALSDEATREAELTRLDEEMPELAERVRAILRADTEATLETVSDLPTADGPPGEGRAVDGPELEDTGQGPYRLIRIIGEGGMGLVYLAEQRSTGQQVAIKVLRPGLVGGRAVERFRREVRTLGRLRHENIAQIFEAGAIPLAQGGPEQPFFAMELVEGPSITAYAAERDLSERQMLRLMITAARAVHHAHTRGVIHRDLKPANIAVTDGGRIKVLDFGIARLVEEGEHDGSTLTEVGQLVGTLAYMSPEQAGGKAEAIDTRTDIYALGLILLEMLTRRPASDFAGRSVVDSLRAVAERELRPSDGPLRELASDLRTIICKACARDVERRYASAEAFAADLERYLRREPISARPPSVIYTGQLFIRRHKTAAVAAVVFLVTLGAGVAATAYQAVVATREADRARQAERSANAVLDFLIEMLASADPENALGEDVTVRDMLARAEDDLTTDEELAQQPSSLFRLHQAIGQTYLSLGLFTDALEEYDAALTLAAELDGEQAALQRLMVKRDRAIALIEIGRVDEGLAATQAAFDELVRDFGDDAQEVAKGRMELARATYEAGDVERAVPLMAEALEAIDEAFPAGDRQVIVARNNYGPMLKDAGRVEEAIAILREAAALSKDEYGADHPQTLVTQNNLAATLMVGGVTDEARELLERVYEGRKRVLGDRHPGAASTAMNLAGIYVQEARLDRAEELTREALTCFEDRFGEAHAKTSVAVNVLAYIAEERGDLETAEQEYRRALDILERLPGTTRADVLAPMNNLAMLVQKRGDFDDALAMFDELIERAVASTGGRDNVVVAKFISNRAQCLIDAGEREQAATQLEEAIGVLTAAVGEDHTWTREASERLAAATGAGEDANLRD